MNKRHTLEDSLRVFRFSRGQSLALVLASYIPIVHVLAVLGTLVVPWADVRWRIGGGVAVLYLLPPVIARCIRRAWPIREGIIAMPSRDYFVWWVLLNLQVVFCRLPFLEEVMRIVPGAYSVWLRLWGSRIGRFIYWAAGLQILDRSFLDIGDGVVFGAGVRLNPHVIAQNKQREMELILATVHIGNRAMIGGYALLTAGTRVADGESTRACQLSPPFSVWEGGRRTGVETPDRGSAASRED